LCESNTLPQPQHQCPHDSCQWLTSEPGAALALLDLDHCSALCTALSSASTFATAAERFEGNEQRHTFAPSLRLHLALGVLLV
jgi:hypothetical protein